MRGFTTLSLPPATLLHLEKRLQCPRRKIIIKKYIKKNYDATEIVKNSRRYPNSRPPELLTSSDLQLDTSTLPQTTAADNSLPPSVSFWGHLDKFCVRPGCRDGKQQLGDGRALKRCPSFEQRPRAPRVRLLRGLCLDALKELKYIRAKALSSGAGGGGKEGT